MEKVMVIVFDSEAKAHEGIRALKQLDGDGDITIYSAALIRRNLDDSIDFPQTGMEDFPIQALSGTAIGGLIGMLAGPAGYAAGASLGGILGFAGDAYVGTVEQDYLDEVSVRLKAGTAAVVLDLDEEWITPVDVELEPFSIAILRRARVDVEDELMDKRIDAMNGEIDRLDQELASAQEDRKAKIQARIDDLKAKSRDRINRFEKRKEQIKSENKVKIEALQGKISAGVSEDKAGLKARLAALQKADKEFQERVESSIATGLRKAAAHFDRKAG